MSLVPLAELEEVIERVALEMTSKQVAMAMWAYGAFKVSQADVKNMGVWAYGCPTRRVIEELEAVVECEVTNMTQQDLSNIITSYPKFGLRPAPSVRAALEQVAERMAPKMTNPQEVSSVLYGFAVLGSPPTPATLDALDAAAERTAQEMNAQEVANILWSFAVFDRSPPSAVIDAASALADGFTTEGLVQCFQAHAAEVLAGRRLKSGPVSDASDSDASREFRRLAGFPRECDFRGSPSRGTAISGWISAELLEHAESAWRRCQVDRVDNTKTSDLHRDVSYTLTGLGREHLLKGLTDDGLFRVDCLIANGQIAVEVNGPACYVEREPTGGTLLRKRLLEARGFRVVSVPGNEWERLRTERDKRAYLQGLLSAKEVERPLDVAEEAEPVATAPVIDVEASDPAGASEQEWNSVVPEGMSEQERKSMEARERDLRERVAEEWKNELRKPSRVLF
jgi:hypothetical protein